MTIERFVKIGVKEKTPKSPGGLDLRVSITAPNMAAVESLLGASYLSDLGPVRAKGHITGTTEVPSIENIAITAGESGPVRLEWQGHIGKVLLGSDQVTSGVEFSGAIHAEKTSALASLAGISIPELGPLTGTWRLVDRNGSLDIERFEISTGLEEKATLLVEGEVNHLRSRNEIALQAAFEAATQPWVEKLIQNAAPENHQVTGTVRLTGATDHFRIEELRIATSDSKGLSLRANGTVREKAGLYEVDAQISSETRNTSFIGSILGVSIPCLSSFKIKGRLNGNTNKAAFEGDAHLGLTHFKTTAVGSFDNQRCRVSAKISSPTVYLADLGIHSNGRSEDSIQGSKSKSLPGSRLFSAKFLPSDVLKALDLSLSLDADKVIGENFVLNKLDLDLSLKDGRLRIDPAKLSYAEGYVSIDLS